VRLKKVLKNAKRTAAPNVVITTFEQNVNQFKLLDYKLSAPVEYKAGSAYAIVKNEFKSPAVAKQLGVMDKNSVFILQ
jgi:hypothetical protein